MKKIQLIFLAHKSSTWTRGLLFFLLINLVLAAMSGGILLMLKPDGSIMRWNLSMLDGTAFRNFAIPGFILAVYIGGTSTIALAKVIQNNIYSPWITGAGVMLIGWITIQIMLLHMFNWLQFGCLIIGVIIVLLSYKPKHRFK